MNGLKKSAPPIAWVLTVVTGILLSLSLSGAPDLMADGGSMILSLGDDSYVTWSEVEARTGAAVRRELEDLPLTDFSVIILSNVSYASLPAAVRDGLSEYLAHGGTLLVTGGKQSYGSGGYVGTELAELLPLKPSRDDFGYNPYGPTLLLQPRHPILQGVALPPMGYFNELELNSSAVEIAQYRKGSKAAFTGGGDPGGGEIGGGGRRPMPLIAEKSVGQGTILAIAMDMALSLDKDTWQDRDRFAQNCVAYLLQRSRIESVTLPKEPVAK
ncbi:hypothetical protein [Candidatus Methylomirabilis sp.]|uniref:hypothetical protein n=1 Tax=Candidatus Methylomirabilis sp. TaxID=2032687 RepID=UPI002A637410|nr:hypothetical protein [Candidatus Methylomirabilis sp.]